LALINVASREIHCKIVYYGPGFCGKTTNIEYIHSQAPKEVKGELLSIATETERTIFFDFLPLDLGTVAGFRTRFHLYTVPGQIIYEKTRVAVLNGSDGIVFVADSNRSRLQDNVASMKELQRVVSAQGRQLADLPLVIQYNKRDLPSALPIPVLNAMINPLKRSHFEAVAVKGQGVFDTLRAISKEVISKL
jgi:hypothetical protein